MNGPEFIAATAAILFMAFLAGWFTHWLISRITRVTRSDMDDLDKMAQELHQAEEERDSTTAFYQQREAELSNRLSQTEAELEAAMDGLRTARSEAENLRAQVERSKQTM
jgi:septal ring factor EnvC (AmiA/AmiB activator)